LAKNIAGNQETSAQSTSIVVVTSVPEARLLNVAGEIVMRTFWVLVYPAIVPFRQLRAIASTSLELIVLTRAAFRLASRAALVNDCLIMTILENSIEPKISRKMNGAAKANSTQAAPRRREGVPAQRRRLVGR
jgi:hypothetical protein